jgi:hypothetical protein
MTKKQTGKQHIITNNSEAAKQEEMMMRAVKITVAGPPERVKELIEFLRKHGWIMGVEN